jgi:hypothetical protein
VQTYAVTAASVKNPGVKNAPIEGVWKKKRLKAR